MSVQEQLGDEDNHLLVEEGGVSKLLWRNRGHSRKLDIVSRNDKVSSELAALSDIGALPEELDEMVKEIGYGEEKVSDGQRRLDTKGITIRGRPVNVPFKALKQIQERYTVRGDRLLEESKDLYGEVKGQSSNEQDEQDDAFEEVLGYLSRDETTGFWELTSYICNELYSNASGKVSMARAGELIDNLELSDIIEGDKTNGYKLKG